MTEQIEHFYQKIQGWMDYEDLYLEVLDRYVKRTPRQVRFVELGSWKGRSAAFMATEIANRVSSGNSEVLFYCVDHWQGISNEAETPKHPYEYFMEQIDPVKDYIRPVRMHTVDAAKQFLDESCEFVWVDADHSYAGVKADILAWLPKVNPDGIIAGHDYTDANFPGVKQAVDELLPNAVQHGQSSWILYPEHLREAKERLYGKQITDKFADS